MFKFLYPDAYAPGVFFIDYQKLFQKGYKAVLFDIDCTLVPLNRDATPEVEALFRQIHEIGLKTVLVSNNDAARIERFLQNIDSPYVCDAKKPDVAGYQKALKLLGISREEAVFVGDYMTVDIYGAKKAGIDSIMVQHVPLQKNAKIGKRRHLENFILFFYNLQKAPHKLDDVIIKR